MMMNLMVDDTSYYSLAFCLLLSQHNLSHLNVSHLGCEYLQLMFCKINQNVLISYLFTCIYTLRHK